METNKQCAICTNPKLPNSEYCEGCQARKDAYEPDEKEEELE